VSLRGLETAFSGRESLFSRQLSAAAEEHSSVEKIYMEADINQQINFIAPTIQKR
jgi:hypothetical protein